MSSARTACQAELHQLELQREARLTQRRQPEGRPRDTGRRGTASPLRPRGSEHRQLNGSVPYDSERAGKPDGVSALTNRELEIAELVSNGHTNRQIARMLCLSEKTIETHLAHTFTKLGVSSRAAVASVVTKAKWQTAAVAYAKTGNM